MSRHDKEVANQDRDRFHMRAGMAKVALIYKRERDLKDAHGQPLSYAKRMSEGVSESQLEKWAKHKRKVYVKV